MAESMRELEFDFDTLGSRIIPLGYQGESMRLQISIDCSEALTTYSAENAALIITAPDGTSYPGDVWEQDGVLLWQVIDRDTAVAGNGSIRVDLVDAGGVTVHSAGAMTVILEENAREADNLRAIQEKVGQLLQCCATVNTTLEDLGGRMEDAEDELDDVNSVITDKDVAWTTALDSAAARMTAIEKILHDLQEEVNALEDGEGGSIAALISDMTQAQADIDALEEDVSGFGTDISTLQETITSMQTSISSINSSISTINGKLQFESTPTESSNKLIRSKDLKTLFDAKQNTLTFDSSPTENSNNPVKSSGIKTALDAKQNTLTFDSSPTANSNNPVKSSGIKTALDAKQNTLTFDSSPTANSNNPVKSSGIKTALDAKQNTLTFDNAPTDGSSNPVKSNGVYDAIHAYDGAYFAPSSFGLSATAYRFAIHNGSMVTVEYYSVDVSGANLNRGDTQFTLFTMPSGKRPKVKTYVPGMIVGSTMARSSPPIPATFEVNTDGTVKSYHYNGAASSGTYRILLNFCYSIV